MSRQVVLDTETTGLDPKEGHRIIEIGCVEMMNRQLTQRTFHTYVNPMRAVEEGALKVHGISNKFLEDKPLFKDIANDLFAFIDGAELIIHNAPFDVGFLNHEFKIMKATCQNVAEICSILDTLALARKLHPGQKNSLDALCSRYKVDNTHRDLHGALLDARLLAFVYLAMTGGQSSFFSDEFQPQETPSHALKIKPSFERAVLSDLIVINATDEEKAAHEMRLKNIEKAAGQCIWRQLNERS